MNAHTRSHAWIRAVHARTALNEGNERTFTWIRTHKATNTHTHTVRPGYVTIVPYHPNNSYMRAQDIPSAAFTSSACMRAQTLPLLHVMRTSHALAFRTVPSAASRPPGVKACVHPITNAQSHTKQSCICDKDSI